MNVDLFFLLNGLAGLSGVSDTVILFTALYVQIVMVALLAGYFFVRLPKDGLPLLNAFFSIAVTAFIVWALGESVKLVHTSPRPFLVLDNITTLFIHGDYGSFPSGHTLALSGISAGLFAHRYSKWGAALLFSAILVGTARVISGVHWPVDIIGGLLFGFGVAFSWHSLFHRRRRRLQRRT